MHQVAIPVLAVVGITFVTFGFTELRDSSSLFQHWVARVSVGGGIFLVVAVLGWLAVTPGHRWLRRPPWRKRLGQPHSVPDPPPDYLPRRT